MSQFLKIDVSFNVMFVKFARIRIYFCHAGQWATFGGLCRPLCLSFWGRSVVAKLIFNIICP